MKKAGNLPEANFTLLFELGKSYLQKSDYKNAVISFKKALDRGLDEKYIDSILKDHPRLKPYFTH